MPDVIYVSIGSNIEPEKHLRQAVAALHQTGTVLAVSSVYQSPPFGFTDQPDFLDIVVALTTDMAPADFKQRLYAIERESGRDRASQANKYGPLTLDMDILLWGETSFSFGSKPWSVPDQGIVEQAAVAIPLAEIAPDVVHPIENVSIATIASRFDPDAITRIGNL
jgi:2-amino-4-hydroxy-6-hydroxymethyldihydropteridine diphosphokinase